LNGSGETCEVADTDTLQFWYDRWTEEAGKVNAGELVQMAQAVRSAKTGPDSV
jgi:hypothetical protein